MRHDEKMIEAQKAKAHEHTKALIEALRARGLAVTEGNSERCPLGFISDVETVSVYFEVKPGAESAYRADWTKLRSTFGTYPDKKNFPMSTVEKDVQRILDYVTRRQAESKQRLATEKAYREANEKRDANRGAVEAVEASAKGFGFSYGMIRAEASPAGVNVNFFSLSQAEAEALVVALADLRTKAVAS